MKKFIIMFLFYVIGLLCLTLGISLMIVANLGVGPWDAMYVALSNNIGFSVGNWVFMIGFLLILINGILLKTLPDFSAVVTIFIIGSFLDIWLEWVFIDAFFSSFSFRFILLLLGIVTIAAGVSLYLQASFARNPIDQLMVAVQFRTGKSIAFSKTLIECSILVIAFLIGGPIGFGTLLVAVVIGPIIQFFLPFTTKLKGRLLPITRAEVIN